MIPHEQAVIADAMEKRGVSRERAVRIAGEIIAALQAEGYVITERRPGA